MDNIVVVEWGKKCVFQNKNEMIERILGKDYFRLNKKEQYERLKLRTQINATFANKPIKDLRNGDKIQDIKQDQYIIFDEDTFILSLAKNKDIVIYEKEDANIFAEGVEKANLERVAKNYIRVNDCVDEILERKIKSLELKDSENPKEKKLEDSKTPKEKNGEER